MIVVYDDFSGWRCIFFVLCPNGTFIYCKHITCGGVWVSLKCLPNVVEEYLTRIVHRISLEQIVYRLELFLRYIVNVIIEHESSIYSIDENRIEYVQDNIL